MDSISELPVEVAASNLSSVGVVAITAAIGLATALWFIVKPRAKPDKDDEVDDYDEDEADPVHQDVPPEYMPEGGVFTAESLKPLDGKTLPLCMGVCGKVVNCSASGSIKHGAGYGALWGGRDATYSLATLSLKPEDACRRDFTVDDFTKEQQKALAGWYKHFMTKYPVIGKMKEYDGWDFSVIEDLAKEETPFGAKKDSEIAAEAAAASRKNETAAAQESEAAVAGESGSSSAPGPSVPSDAQVFSKNDRVQLRNLVDDPDLNGLFGILADYNAEKGRFVIRIESTGKEMLFLPSNLMVVKA